MTIYDCSVPLSEDVVTWPGEPSFSRKVLRDIKKDGAEVHELTLSAHTGTHVDAPRHFIAGAVGLDSFPVDAYVGPATVIDLTAVVFAPDQPKEIEPEHLAEYDLSGVSRVLFKTENSVRDLLMQSEFVTDYVSLSLATAELLVKNGIRLIGVDYLSIEKKGNPGHPVHTAVLGAGIVNVEGVRLTEVPAGDYTVAALPLNLVNADGSPARVVLYR
ncbi:MAG: hypothetical protein COW24_04350 [Candidatus Kerfeldbacteria bacterium CG15_BIG_FIL_POST_REV_8_21_14_020_45_12]|uniref:Kynurenine formamidase n=1 Tax=Candidatus Kerfeldbacteria bacterium CG15_BIG_FIL_POST_REV_8_21_14_020_45_12 TaxID=2014247 RepID=A0A2M7H310_9BACT|nr:MAG: hypothetical protein COW24_04350 [Candidatus Kerfeldbacteria bacterium CG15_BIG_FIL_POST_REV_8_21_14_020_45_12]PJA93394.1 MAG: hypothetical protein CO132_03495 [Candidatus Kerfeldbacteria bacterium CG_4_9_14_3_um_filter_45_8]